MFYLLQCVIGVDPARVRGSGPSWNFASEGPPLFGPLQKCLKHGYEIQWTQYLSISILMINEWLCDTSHCCHQTRFWALNAPKMRLRPGLWHGPRWGSLQRSPRSPIAVFEGEGEGKRGKGRERRRGEGKGREGKWTLETLRTDRRPCNASFNNCNEISENMPNNFCES